MCSHTNEWPQRCDICDKGFIGRAEMEAHRVKHTNERDFACDECDKMFKFKCELKIHKRVHTNERPFTCTICDKSFKQSGHLQTHEMVHSLERPYLCEKCDKGFRTKWDLTVHQRIHAVDKAHLCEEYKYTCADVSAFKRHKAMHRGETKNRVFCDQCGAGLATQQGLKIHMMSHAGAKPHQCSQCNQSFLQKSHLTRHCKLVHGDDKPYSCTICDKSFKLPEQLTLHLKRHNGEKPHSCSLCPYRCLEKSHLKSHMRTHTRDIPFQCSHCGQGLRSKQILQRHEEAHEKQADYKFLCNMQDGGTQPWSEGYVQCTVRCKDANTLAYHIERHHTSSGLAEKRLSEQKLADFLTQSGIVFDHDWDNFINFRECKTKEGGRSYVRPDFFLPVESARLRCLAFIENQEMQHITYSCELQRIFNCANALEQTDAHRGSRMLMIMFNPHSFMRDGIRHDLPLEQGHLKLLKLLQKLTADDLQDGVNLIYVNYDETDGELHIFQKDSENDFVEIFRDCVIQHI